jgi:hypothetical protein
VLFRWHRVCGSALCAPLTAPSAIPATVAVRYTEGLVHGFLVLRILESDTIADGRRVGGAAAGKTTARYSRLGAWRSESGFRQIGGPTLLWGPDSAD